jgi:membrane-associated phospholipid phosphatase
MSNFAMGSDVTMVLWAAAAVLLVLYIMRRRKRKLF